MEARYLNRVGVILLSTLLVNCSTSNRIDIEQEARNLPNGWQMGEQNQTTPADKISFDKPMPLGLQTYINKAIEKNPALEQSKFELESMRYRAEAEGTALWPSLDLNIQNSVQQLSGADESSNSALLGLTLKYEVDIWGRLSAADQQTNLTYLKLQTQHIEKRNMLVADVMTTYFGIVEASQQLSLNKLRLKNTENNLAIIEAGYEQGLNDALDVYLTRNDLANEQSNIAAQTQTRDNLVRKLKQYLGDYPNLDLIVADDILPQFSFNDVVITPSDVVKNHPKLKAAWQGLLASNAAVAFAHKQRFPSFSLSLGATNRGADLGAVLSEFDFGWSLIGNITAPLFNAGRLKANQYSAMSSLKALEQNYQSVFIQTFETIERLLANQQNLQTQLNANLVAEKNAIAAEQLAFEQYIKGLVNYATVLASQTRSFNAQSAVIRLKYQLLQNQIDLFAALGGEFSQQQMADNVAKTIQQQQVKFENEQGNVTP